MNAENYSEKINNLIDYKDLVLYYMFDEHNALGNERDLMDQIEYDIDFYLRLSLEYNRELPLLN